MVIYILNMDTNNGLDWRNYKLHLNINKNMFKFLNIILELKLNSNSPFKIDSNGINLNIHKALVLENNQLNIKNDRYFRLIGQNNDILSIDINKINESIGVCKGIKKDTNNWLMLDNVVPYIGLDPINSYLIKQNNMLYVDTTNLGPHIFKLNSNSPIKRRQNNYHELDRVSVNSDFATEAIHVKSGCIECN